MNGPFDPLVAAAIHDAKNALLSIDTQLAQAAHRPTSVDFLKTRAAVARVAAQLAELLTLYRAQSGQLRLAIDDHDLNDFLDDLLAELGPPSAGIAMEIDREAALRVGVWAFDAYLVRLALLDALRNAMRHAKSHVSLALDTLTEGGIRFRVADDGPGFPADILDGSSAPASSGGTGLGLAFAHIIAERHMTPAGRHGRIDLANPAGGGASFGLVLP